MLLYQLVKVLVSINNEINPVLGWGWAIATIIANIVWCLPQFTLGTSAVTQNLFPDFEESVGASNNLYHTFDHGLSDYLVL